MYRRNLPHWYPDGANVFVTWRLSGSLPLGSLLKVADGTAFRDADRQLDRAVSGPFWLKEPSIAHVVVEILEAAHPERGLCRVHDYVVMPNHVHLLIRPIRPLKEVTKWIKGASARKANQLLGRTGQPFWQDESFDHWVRNQSEFEKIGNYIRNNPVHAGLVAEPEQWPYSSAARMHRKEVTG